MINAHKSLTNDKHGIKVKKIYVLLYLTSPFLGSIVSLNATVTNKCPYKCRPKEHKDWSHC